MGWQEIIVGIVAVVVAIAVAHRVWRFFKCGASQCDGCSKECSHRRNIR